MARTCAVSDAGGRYHRREVHPEIQDNRLQRIFLAAAGLVFAGIVLEHTHIHLLMIAGGFIAALADDALQVRTNTRLQNMFPSEHRATLISIECFTFSIIMIVFSPLAGFFFSVW